MNRLELFLKKRNAQGESAGDIEHITSGARAMVDKLDHTGLYKGFLKNWGRRPGDKGVSSGKLSEKYLEGYLEQRNAPNQNLNELDESLDEDI